MGCRGVRFVLLLVEGDGVVWCGVVVGFCTDVLLLFHLFDDDCCDVYTW